MAAGSLFIYHMYISTMLLQQRDSSGIIRKTVVANILELQLVSIFVPWQICTALNRWKHAVSNKIMPSVEVKHLQTEKLYTLYK